jgi:hypothetical protein
VEDQVPVFIFSRNRVAELCPQTFGSDCSSIPVFIFPRNRVAELCLQTFGSDCSSIPVFIFPRNRVAELCPQTFGSDCSSIFFAASERIVKCFLSSNSSSVMSNSCLHSSHNRLLTKGVFFAWYSALSKVCLSINPHIFSQNLPHIKSGLKIEILILLENIVKVIIDVPKHPVVDA